MRRFFPAFLALVTFTMPAVAQAKHPFTFEDMMKLRRVGEPEVSPDGKWVIFSVVDVDLEANTKTPHIWIVPTAGGQERDIIADRDATRPRWAPDGKHFAFLSTLAGKSQVFSADFDGATGKVTRVEPLTSIATEAGGELWSPDGKNILFTSDVYPECDGAPAQEAACNAKKLLEVEASKVKAQIFDHLLYRHWNAYKEGKRTHIFITPATPPKAGGSSDFVLPVHSPAPRDLTPGDYDAPVFSLGGQDNYAFSPDGQEICYTSNRDKSPGVSTNNDLWTVPVAFPHDATSAQVLAQTKNITADNPASDSTPLYSADGRYIAYRAQRRPGYESDQLRLVLYDRKTGQRTPFGPSKMTDYWVGTFTWAPDSSKIYFVAEDKGESPIYSVLFKINPREIEKGYDIVVGGSALNYTQIARGFNDDVTVAPDGKTLFFTRMSITSPNEIFAAPVPPLGVSDLVSSLRLNIPETVIKKNDCCGVVVPITNLNDAFLSQVAMSPLEPFWFTGAHDDKVEGFLVKPPKFDASKKYPVKFLIHGGPEGAWGDDWSYRWNAELFAAPTSSTPSGYVVIMINFHGSTGYGQKFVDAINGDWGGAPFEDLMKGLDYAEEHYAFIDKDRECALGASYGGYMANWILGHTDRFKCIVSHDGMFNAESAWGTTEELWFNDWEFKGTPYDNRASYEKWSPHQFAKNFKTPTLVIHGQRDYRLDVSEGLQLFTTLQMERVPSKMLYFPDEGHWVLKPQNSRLWYETVNAWVDQWTKDPATKDQGTKK
jgi:dipeptidyl aminopeptidase/acylaminoacyl peptidase